MANHHYAARARRASGINVLLGCSLIGAAWILGYALNANPFWTSIVAAGMVALLLAARRFSLAAPQRAVELAESTARFVDDRLAVDLRSRCQRRGDVGPYSGQYRHSCVGRSEWLRRDKHSDCNW